eukprot:6202329-Pleurochrysis_carterae.AAC.3
MRHGDKSGNNKDGVEREFGDGAGYVDNDNVDGNEDNSSGDNVAGNIHSCNNGVPTVAVAAMTTI